MIVTEAQIKERTGKRFSRLTTVKYLGHQKWLCKCDCGNEKIVEYKKLTQGEIKSCRCLKREIQASRLSKTSEYIVYNNMVDRCYNKKNKNYHNYGGRGIRVCDRWLESFKNFFNDMGERPTLKHTLDRINNDGNYEPTNCRWATTKEQGANKRVCHYIEVNGQRVLLKYYCEENGINYLTALSRLYKGYPTECVISKAKYHWREWKRINSRIESQTKQQ